MRQIFSVIGTNYQSIVIGDEKTPEEIDCNVVMESERPADDSISQADGSWASP